MKERFSVSMDDDLVKWLDSMVDEKIFSSRSHALEFCEKQFSNLGIENIIMFHWSKNDKEPVFFSTRELDMVKEFKKKHNLPTMEEALRIVLLKGMGMTKEEIEEYE